MFRHFSRPWKVQFFAFVLTSGLLASGIHSFMNVAVASETEIVGSQSTWSLIQSRLRVRTFTELMAPAFDGNTDSVPRSDGSPYAPSNTFNIFWADYEIAPNLKVVYWQRMLVFLNSNPQFQGVQFLPRDPRFALRFTQVFNVPDLTTTYDVFFQLPFTDNVLSNRNNIELGFRTNTSYAFPKSHWSIGLVQEFTTAYFGGRGGARAFGWAMPWASYELTKTFSTQTALSFPFQNRRSNPSWTEFVWDDPGSAYIQNGIGINVTNQVWMAVFLNNYLFAPVSLNNTWASLWLSLTIL